MTVSRLSELGAAPAPSRVSRRGRSLARAVGAVALVALGAVATWWMLPSEPPAVPVVRALTQSGSDSSPAASPDGKLVAFSSSRDGIRRIWVKQLATGSEVPLTVGEDDHPRFAPDGSVLLFVRRTGTRVALHRVAVMGGEERKLIDDAIYGDFAPDGRRVCFVRQRAGDGEMISTVGIAAADGSALRELGTFRSALVHPRWSWDGKTVALTETALQAMEPTAIVLVDVKSGRVRRLAPPSPAGIWPGGLAWASRRDVLYSQPESVVGMQSGSGSRLMLQDVRSRAAREVLWSAATVLRIDVLGSGRVVFEARALSRDLREHTLLSDRSVPPRWLTSGHGSERQPVYSPDGEWVVVSSNRSGSLDLWAIARHTGAVRRLTDDAAEDWDPGFTRDGKLLWSSNRTGHFEVWLAEADGTGARRVSDDGVDAQNPVATPDGQWIVYASANPSSQGIVKVRRDGSQSTLLVPGNVVLPEVSPDGRYVAFVADLGSEHAALRVAHLDDGQLTSFVVELSPWVAGGSIDVGRCRWLPDGRAVAYIERSPHGAYGVYVQDFLAATDTRSSRRLLVPLDPEHAAESFGISPDGAHLTVAYWDQRFNLMIAERVPGIDSPSRTVSVD